MIVGGLISAAIAMALGYPLFRLRGHYFVIATIVIAEIAFLLFQNWDWAGAALGIDVPVRERQLAELPIRPQQAAVSSISRWRSPASPGS